MILPFRDLKDRFAARNTLGDVARADDLFYQQNYARELRNLRDTALGLGGTTGDAYAGAQEGIKGAGRLYDVAAGGIDRARSRMGIAPQADVAANQGRRLSLARIISQVDAGNRGSERAIDAQRTAQEVGTQMYANLTSSSNNILADVASAETDRDSQRRGANANKKAGLLAGIGTAVGIAAMFI